MLSHPLRAYLILLSGNCDIETSVHRDLETITDVWNKTQNKDELVAIIHVGFIRLDTEKIKELDLNKYIGRMLLTESAKWSLFSICETSKIYIATIDKIPLYIALDGWGYSIDDHFSNLSIPESKSKLSTTLSDWLEDLDATNQDLANALAKVGIYSEKSYIDLESELPAKYRHEAGVYRFSKLASYEDNDPISILGKLPPWLLGVALVRLNLKVRTYNALLSEAFTKTEDLKTLSTSDLLKIPNFGETSKQDLLDKLKSALIHGLGIEAYVAERPISISKKTQSDLPKSEQVTQEEPLANLATFYEQLKYELNKMSSIDRDVLASRMGFDTESASLEKIGQKFQITRERIRQIESRALKNISVSQTWVPALEQRLLSLLREREFPLLFSGLEEYDPWFKGVQNFESCFSYILDNKHLVNGKFSLIEVNGRLAVSEIDTSEWEGIQKRATENVKRLVSKKLVMKDLRTSVENLLQVRGRELRSELWNMIKNQAHFSTTNDAEFSILVGYGKTIESVVAAILADSDKPLHFTEIAEIFVAKEGRKVTYHQIHATAANVGLLFGRGSYGLLKHLQLTAHQVKQISDSVVRIISEGQDSRQWSTTELLGYITKTFGTFDNILNMFTLNICLNNREELKYLGRNVWVSSRGDNDQSQSRIDITQAVTSLLVKFGRPMTNKEIKVELAKDRGVNASFQIHPIDSLINLGGGLWGLIERDIPLNVEDQRKVTSAMKHLLDTSQHGLPVENIVEIFRNDPELISKTDNPDIYAGVAVKSGLIKRSKEDCLYLAEWGNDRLMRRSEAILKVLENNPSGLAVDELARQAQNLLGRNLKRDTVYPILSSLGAFFNHDNQLWQLKN